MTFSIATSVRVAFVIVPVPTDRKVLSKELAIIFPVVFASKDEDSVVTKLTLEVPS